MIRAAGLAEKRDDLHVFEKINVPLCHSHTDTRSFIFVISLCTAVAWVNKDEIPSYPKKKKLSIVPESCLRRGGWYKMIVLLLQNAR